MASVAGRSVRWIADPLGHADPVLTLRVYAHAMRQEESDLSFATCGALKRPYPVPLVGGEQDEAGNVANSLARREGFDPPTLRLEGCLAPI